MGGHPSINEIFEVASALPDNKQQWQSPSGIHTQLPGLRASPFWDKHDFPWLLPLEEQFESVRKEVLKAEKLIGFKQDVSGHLPEKARADWQAITVYANTKWNEKICRIM